MSAPVIVAIAPGAVKKQTADQVPKGEGHTSASSLW
jgi:hypothetical protein